MARVRTFCAWRYATRTPDITPLTSPPYDVISDVERARFAAEPHNVVELELPCGPTDPAQPENRYGRSRETWDQWRSSGVLALDPSPALYVLEQRFDLAGRSRCRRAFLVEVGLERFDAGIVLPHERTLPKALGDRFEMIKATAANYSPVFGLFEDAGDESGPLFTAATAGSPVATAKDAAGVTSTLWACDDAEVGTQLTQLMTNKRVFIADGHHRYTTALAYRDLVRAEAAARGEQPADSAADYVLMALVNMDDPDLAVLPYNRIVDGESFDASEFRRALERDFVLTELETGHPAGVLERQSRTAFLVKTAGSERPFLAVLRPEVDPATRLGHDHSAAWNSLDVAVLQELVLWPLLGVHPDHPETLERLRFTSDPHEAFRATAEHDVAFVVRPTGLSELRAVSLAGETMPQKSTYFYPKVPSGMLFRSAE